MTRLLVALGAFLITISLVWVVSSHPGNQTMPAGRQAQQADVYIKSGTLLKKTSSSPTPASSPTPTFLVPQTLLTPSSSPTLTSSLPPTATPTITSTVLTTPTPTTIPTKTPTPTLTPTSTPTNTPAPSPATTPTPSSGISLTLLALTSPVAQKQTATVKIQSAPAAQCIIAVTLPSGTVSTSKDLAAKTALDDGTITWSWSINWNTKTGTATIKLACTKDGQTASGQTTMEIIASQ